MVTNFLELIQIPEAITSQSACKDQPWEYFDGDTVEDVLKAQNICQTCPVRDLCLEWAITHEVAGIWGGKTPRQRARMRGNRQFVDIEAVCELIDQKNFLWSDSAENLAVITGTTARTIYRRRAALKRLEAAM